MPHLTVHLSHCFDRYQHFVIQTVIGA